MYGYVYLTCHINIGLEHYKFTSFYRSTTVYVDGTNRLILLIRPIAKIRIIQQTIVIVVARGIFIRIVFQPTTRGAGMPMVPRPQPSNVRSLHMQRWMLQFHRIGTDGGGKTPCAQTGTDVVVFNDTGCSATGGQASSEGITEFIGFVARPDPVVVHVQFATPVMHTHVLPALDRDLHTVRMGGGGGCANVWYLRGCIATCSRSFVKQR